MKKIVAAVETKGNTDTYTQDYRFPCGERAYELQVENAKCGGKYQVQVRVTVKKGHDVFEFTSNDGGLQLRINEVTVLGVQTHLTDAFAEQVVPLLETFSRELDACVPPLPKGVDRDAERLKKAQELDAADALARLGGN